MNSSLDAHQHQLLDTAIERLETLSGESGLHWQHRRVQKRHRSSILELAAMQGDRLVARAYYKEHFPPAHFHDQARARFRASVEESIRISEAFDVRLASALGQQVLVPRVLAVDAPRLRIVNLAVPGVPLGKAYRWLGHARHRRRAISLFSKIGAVVRVIEGTVPSEGGAATILDEATIERALEYATGSTRRSDLPRLRCPIRQLVRDVHSQAPSGVYVHGDLSNSNILVEGYNLGLIDFSWTPALPGTDLATLAIRMEFEWPQVTSWTEQLTNVLLEGYGDASVTAGPIWDLLRVRRLLWVAGRGRGSMRRRVQARRAVDRIHRILEASRRF